MAGITLKTIKCRASHLATSFRTNMGVEGPNMKRTDLLVSDVSRRLLMLFGMEVEVIWLT